ncbi:MAG: hypothetical protein IKL10_06070 [Clostridia bacterium]|nr:hypothetical protein [Clostridia bacterium]
MLKILSVLFSFLMLFPSYLLSFLPWNFETEFDINTLEEDGIVFEVSEDGLTYDFGGYENGWYNYYGIKYKSDAYIKGTLTYLVYAIEKSEDFFLEPSENGEFYSFLDGYLNNERASGVLKLEFTPLGKEEADFELLGIGLFNREVYDTEIYIENDEHKLGIDLNWGGALSYLEDKNSSVEAVKVNGITKVDSNASKRYNTNAISRNVNLINANDTGRLVQQSYYGTGDCAQYEGGFYGENKWNYNPVQGGNQYNDAAKIVDVKITDESIYIKCRPLDWAKEKEYITPSYMEATYSLSEGLVKASCRFVDYSGYPEVTTTQECPAFYCIEPLNRFVYYSGDKPWTNDSELSYENDLIFWPDAGYPNFSATENWSAFIGEFDDSFGIGLYVPNEASFLAGVFSRGNCTTNEPAKESPTSYIAAVEVYEFKSFNPTEYSFWLSTGTADEIRNNFSTVK